MSKVLSHHKAMAWSSVLLLLTVLLILPPGITEVSADPVDGSFDVGLAISDVSVSDIDYYDATISWNTNGQSTSQVFYDTQFHEDIIDYSYQTALDVTLVLDHIVELTGLPSGTTCHFRVRSVGDVTVISDDYVFTTRSIIPPGPTTKTRYYMTIDLFGETFKWRTSYSGRLLEPVDITLEELGISIYIPEGTYCQDEDGNRLTEFSVDTIAEHPMIPEDCCLLSDVYDLSPDGAIFDPYLRLTLCCQEGNIPDESEENAFYIAYFNQEWVPLESGYIAEENAVFADVTHFTTFAAMSNLPPPAPAEFIVSNLEVSPATAEAGEEVTITFDISNTGGREGSESLDLMVDEELEATKQVTLAPDAMKTVVFTVTRDNPGSYSVTIGDLDGSFIVREAASAAPTTSTISFSWIIAGPILGLVIFLAVFLSLITRKKIGQKK
ncbi:CARDB domain-containing protein [Chloroflexota bacterium]